MQTLFSFMHVLLFSELHSILSQVCEALLTFSCEKMILSLSIHQYGDWEIF